MSTTLDCPSSPDDLYFARGHEVDSFRPHMQGDVFRDVLIPGVEDEDARDRLAIVVTHPCSMRRGARLVSHVHVVRVRFQSQTIPLDRWASGYFRLMPLPALFPDQADGLHVACFEELGRIATDQLRLDRRVACLSDEGIILLQQRLVHYMTRVIVTKRQLLDHVQHLFDEAELQEEWTRALLGDRPEGEVLRRLESEVARFDDFLSEDRPGGNSLRDDMKNPENRAAVRRAVRAEIRLRREQSGSA